MRTALNSKRKQALLTGLLSVVLFAYVLLTIFKMIPPLPSFFAGLGLLASFCCFFWAWQSWKEARQIRLTLGGRTTVAYWQYTTEECQRYVELWFPSQVKKRGLLYKAALVIAWLIVAIVSIGIINRLFRGAGVGNMPTLLLVSTLAALLFIAYSSLRRLGGPVGVNRTGGLLEAYISSDGVLVNNHYTSFHKLINVSYSKGDPSTVEFLHQIWGRSGMKPYKVSVPVPPDQEGKVDGVIQALGYGR